METENELTVNLAEMTDGGRIPNLSGRPRGLAARSYYHLDWSSMADVRRIVVKVPQEVDSLTPSFFQGMFGAAFRALGKDRNRFHQSFTFDANNLIQAQIEQGLSALEISRDLTDLS